MSKRKYKILIVDDSAEDRAAFRRFLQKTEEFECLFLEAELGESGIKLCLEKSPDCILLDYNLPDTDGLAVIKQLIPNALNPAFPIILLTGEGSEKIAVNAIKSGAQDYLVKGKFSSEELILSVTKATEIVELRRKNRRAMMALAESESRLNAILQNTNAVIYLTDEQNRFVHINRHFENLFHLKAEEIHGKSLHEIFPKKFADTYAANNVRVMETRQPVEAEEIVMQEDGVHTYLSLKVPHFDAGGDLRGVVGISTDITERKRAEIELIESQNFAQSIIQTAPNVLYTFDLKSNRTTYLTGQAVQTLGYSEAELKSYFADFLPNFMHPEDANNVESHFKKIHEAKNGEVFEFEYRMRNKAGEWHWFRSRDKVFKRDENGEVREILGIALDITESKKAENELRINRERLNQLHFIVSNPDLSEKERLNRLIRLGCEKFNLENGIVGEVTGGQYRVALAVTPDDSVKIGFECEATDAFCDEVLKKNDLLAIENVGGSRWREHRAYSIFAPEVYLGTPLTVNGAIYGTLCFTSKSPRNKPFTIGEQEFLRLLAQTIGTELSRQNVSGKLRESEKHLSALFNQTVSGIAETDLTGRFIFVNDRYCEITGYTREELIGGMRMQNITHPDDLPINKEDFRRLVQQGTPFSVEKRYIRKDGAIIWVGNSVSATTNAEDKRQSIVAVMVDITESKLAEQALRESAEIFRIASDAAAALVYNVDLTGERKTISYGLERVTGYTDKEAGLSGNWFHSLIHPEDLPAHLENLARQLESGSIYRAAHRLKRKDGVWIWVEDTGQIFRDENGKAIQLVGAIVDITPRKQAEAEVKALSDYNREVLESITDPFFTLDREWRFTYMSAQGEKLVFRQSGELLGKSLWNEFPGVVGSSFEKLYREAMNGKIVGSLTDYYPDHDRWYEVTIYPAPNGITVYFRDLTERKRAELNLAFLADLSKDFAPLSSVAEILEVAGARIAEHFSLSRCVFVEIEKVSGEAIILHEHRTDDVPKLASNYNRAGFYTDEEMRRMSEGKTVWINDVRDEPRPPEAVAQFEDLGIRALASAPFINEGRWKFVLSAQYNQPHQWNKDEYKLLGELSSRTWTRIERARAEEALRESEKKYRTLFDSIDEGFCVIEMLYDENGKPNDYRYLETNPTFEKQTGLVDAKGKTIRELAPEIEPSWFEIFGRVARTGEPVRFENYAAPLNRWFECYGFPTDAPELNRVGVIFNEVTERRQIEVKRQEMLEREQDLRRIAEEANRAKDEFLAVLSHELRTPLNAMYGWTQILEHSDFDRKKTKHAIEIIARNVRLQNALIEDLLDVSRIISGKMRLESERTSLVSIVESSVDTARPLAESRLIQIESNLDQSADEMFGDKHRLQQIVSNLLTNAIKFTPENGTIKLTLERIGDFGKLTIQDSGIGIAPELLPKIFERFRQADASSKRQFGGLGLGLTIVKHLTELHDGTISAYSDGENKGATFIVELPLAPQTISHADLKPAGSERESSRESKPLAEVNILLVDDDPDALDLLRFVLEQNGAVITCVNSAREGLKKLRNNKFDLLISDLGMAEMDGYDLIREVRASADKCIAELPAIALTGYVSSEDRERVLLAGFQTHLPKPLDIQDLSVVIINLIKNYGETVE